MFPASYISSLKGMSCIRGCSSLEVPNEILYLEGSYLCEMEVKSGMKFQTMFNMCGVCTHIHRVYQVQSPQERPCSS